MLESNIEIKKTARYFTIGKRSKQTKDVWFIIHGYAQLAKNILEKFEGLESDEILFVAPEGLNKFYSRGFAGNPVASWMSSEDRLNEIKDYCAFLNQLYVSFELEKNPQININVFGFSQGVTTASRWIMSNNFRFNKFVLYAGEIAKEYHQYLPVRLANIPSVFVRGNADSLVAEERIENLMRLYINTKHKLINFDGGHEVTAEMAELIISDKD